MAGRPPVFDFMISRGPGRGLRDQIPDRSALDVGISGKLHQILCNSTWPIDENLYSQTTNGMREHNIPYCPEENTQLDFAARGSRNNSHLPDSQTRGELEAALLLQNR